jgi:hypothetical protein
LQRQAASQKITQQGTMKNTSHTKETTFSAIAFIVILRAGYVPHNPDQRPQQCCGQPQFVGYHGLPLNPKKLTIGEFARSALDRFSR